LEQSVPEGLHHMERTDAGVIHGGQQPVGRTHVGEVSQNHREVRVGSNLKDRLVPTPLP